MSIRTKLFLTVLALAVPALVLTGLLSYLGGRAAVEKTTMERLTAVRADKARQIEEYVKDLRRMARFFARDPMIVDAMTAFDESRQMLDDVEITQEQRDAVSAYYTEQFLPRLGLPTGAAVDRSDLVPTDAADIYLQYLYIVANDSREGEKALLDDPGDGSRYSEAHSLFHPVLRDFVHEFGLYDLFLISGSGHIAYTVSKEVDFATDLIDGPYRDTNLADVFHLAERNALDDEVQLVDFAPYAPSYGEPASFVAAPIVNGAWLVGVLVFQLDVGEIDDVMTNNRNWKIDGLGETGETYLIGPDSTMRSNSRFFLEDPEGYLEAATTAGDPAENIEQIRKFGTTILLQDVRTDAASAALAGESATTTGRDYRGIEVLTSYAPLAIEGVDWAILSEIDAREAFARVAVMTRNLVLSLASLLALVLVAAWVLSRRFVAPIVELDDAAQHFAAGDQDVEVPISRRDELGVLARTFNQMVSAIRQKTVDLERTAEELEGVSSVILRWDTEGRILFMNDFGLELFGYTRDELDGQPLSGSIVPASEEADRNIRRMAREIASDPARYEIDETENRRKDGERIWMAWRNSPILGDDGSLREILTIGIDITERRRIEREIAEQKQLLENTLESLTHPFYVIDAKDYTIQIANSTARALAASGETTCHALSHKRDTPCDSSEHRCPLAEVKKTKKPCTVEHIHVDAEGRPRYMEVNGYPIFDDDGNVVQMIEYSIDITERKEAELELRKLSRAVEQSSSSVVITDPAGTIEYANPKFSEITGYALEEVIGENPRVLKSGDQPDEFYADLWATIASGREWHGEFCNRKKSGELYWESASISPIRDAAGEITHYVAIKDDITERKRMEEDLLKAREAAEAANRAKSTFLANMSHELRTPMNAIIGYSEMLAEDAEDEGHDEMIPDLEKINAAGKHLLALINDILDLSKIEAGRMELYLETFDLRSMLDEAADTIAPLIAKNDNRLVTDIADNLGAVRLDLTKLRQALFNLLSNAAKFTEGGTITLSAARQRRDGEEWLTLSVTDTGIGIPQDKLDRVFEEFAQADDSTTRDYGGTGLGLPISRRFCRMMGGDITVASTLGEGTTFTIELPARVSALEAARSAAKAETPAARSARSGTRPILVIDDDPNSRDLLQRTLESDGFEVVTAATGEEGLELTRAIKPALITLDVLMPSMDGWTVLQEIKGDPELADIPVLMISIAGDKDLGFTLGAVESLTKPVDRDKLRRLVRQYASTTGGGHALVVDDDETIRSLFRRVLTEDGWTVAEAENGAVAIELVKKDHPDLVLLDLMMPVMDGFEFVMHFRKIEGCGTIPVIVVTAKDLDQSERESLLGGVERIVEKGALSRQQLLQQVRELVAHHDSTGKPEDDDDTEQG